MWISQVDIARELDNGSAVIIERVRGKRSFPETLLPVRELTHHIHEIPILSVVHMLNPHAAISHGSCIKDDPCAKGAICG